MSRTVGWSLAGLIAVVIAAVLGLMHLPYLPAFHGTDADEIDQLAAWLQLRPGSHVADFGAGDGGHAISLAERIGPSGHVFANELSTELLDQMREAAAGLDNFTVVEGDVSRSNLPSGCCDAIFSRNVYHHLTDPAAINADLRRALRPGGRLLIIDFEPGGFMDWVSPPDTAEKHGGHGTPTDTVVDEVTAAGFRLLRGPEPWRGRLYAVMFERAP